MRDLTEELSILLSKYKAALICRSANDNDSSVEIGIQDCKAGNLWLGRHHLTGYDLLGKLPITLKPFDISEHEFLESDIQGGEVVGEMLRLHLMSQDLPYVEHSKPDAIAIAKALGVTGEDLK